MPTLTDREKRTIRLATVTITIYLALFFGARVWKHLEKTRFDYQKLVMDAQKLRQEIQPYENKALLIEKLKENFHLDLSKLSRTSLVAQASAAIQKAAQTGGIQLGPIRESPARPSTKEIASMQLEVAGPVPAVLSFLHRLGVLGYPLIIDSVQIAGSDPTRPGGPGGLGGPGGPGGPGGVKLNLTIVILDFEQWKNEGARHA